MNDRLKSHPGIWEKRGAYYLMVNTKTGELVSENDIVTDFRGDRRRITYLERGPERNGTAKVVAGGRSLYSTVFDLKVLLWIEPGGTYEITYVDRENGGADRVFQMEVESVGDILPIYPTDHHTGTGEQWAAKKVVGWQLDPHGKRVGDRIELGWFDIHDALPC